MIWRIIENFSPKENWGDPNKMSGTLLLTLDAVRRFYDHPFVIHCGFATTGHSEASFHYKGEASDFDIKEPGVSFHTQIIKFLHILDGLQLSGSVGLGIYPQWNNPGFHLDVRGESARWGYLNGDYCSFGRALDYTERVPQSP